MTPQENVDLKIVVRNADDMDEWNFRKHMSVRHSESLAGQYTLPPFASDYVEECYRTFHDTIHRLSLYGEVDHEHGK